ncbi:MAG TPA: hypothetical protein VHR41_14700 [Gemmatimonadales bacterium]|jgi:hypothetical protein|nr:hypothetical protein [Gemmatimonadales bacterium]
MPSYAADSDEPGEERRRPLAFVLLVVALSLPFWLIGALLPLEPLPGL